MAHKKVTSVLQLSKYKIGSVVYWVTLRPVYRDQVTIQPDNEWMTSEHPKIWFDYDITRKWKFKTPPKLCAFDFKYVIEILTSEPIVERFMIRSVARSNRTGEYHYCNDNGEWMPESYLFTDKNAAKKEKAKLKRAFLEWSKKTFPDQL